MSTSKSMYAVAMAALGLSCSAFAGEITRYRIVTIPAPDGTTYFSVNDLNNSDQATGTASGDQRTFVFRYSDGVSTIIDDVPGTQSSANGLNDASHVTGTMYEWGVIWPEAYLWDGSECHWLGTYSGRYSYGYAVNDLDQVVGYWYGNGAHANGNAFFHDGQRMFDLGAGIGMDVNNDGIVVGQNNRGFGDACVWEPDGNGWKQSVLQGTAANAINESGSIIVGAGPFVSYFDTPTMWTRDGNQWVRTGIGNFDPSVESAEAIDVNDAGQIIGNYESFENGHTAFLYEGDEIIWLNDRLTDEFADWSVTRAITINESGHILAVADYNGAPRSVILIPDELSILAPRPGVAGRVNEFIVTGATPNDRVHFVYGTTHGKVGLPGCPGVELGIRKPQIAGSAIADANGSAHLSKFVPRSVAGRRILLQAVETQTCSVSNVLPYRLR